MNREELIEIYQDTIEMCSMMPFPHSEKKELVQVPKDKQKTLVSTNKGGNVVVEPLDTVSALIKYSSLGKTAILNMASERRKGGGVANGAMAQEECLFRCSNLFTISDGFYPLGPLEYVYTNDATFIKDRNYGTMQPVTCDVITMPAINTHKYEYSELLTLLKIGSIIDFAIENDCDNLILGAWGCGVFGNNPEIMSNLFHKALFQYGKNKAFKNVVFAIINDENSVGNNYKIFRNTFEESK